MYKNQAGFVTERPVRWALAFEAYVNNNEGVRCRWQYKIDETSNKYSECELMVYFETSRHVNVKIYLLTGTIIVTGAPFKDWIKSEFQKVVAEFTNQPEHDKGVKAITKPEPEDRDTEIDLLWEKYDEISNAIITQDENCNDMLKRCQKFESLFENHQIEMEKKFDDKLIVFRDSILEELRKEIGAVKSDSVSRFTAVNSAVADTTHKTINDNQVKRETFEKNTQLKMENFLNEKKSIDISELTNSLQFETNERIDENKKQREGIQKNQESITSFDIKINHLLSTTMQKMPPIYESESGDLKSRIKELQGLIKLRDNEKRVYAQ